MGLFSKDKDIVDLLRKENKQLKDKLLLANRELDAVSKYRDEYKKLIHDAKRLKERYSELNKKYEEIFNEAKRQLESL